MVTYFMFGDYSAEGIQEISADRTTKCHDIIKKLGGNISNSEEISIILNKQVYIQPIIFTH